MASFTTLVCLAVLLGASASAAASSGPVQLTAETFDASVLYDGKAAIVKFFAPWCGHCKRMKPDYEKLAEAFADDSTVLIGEVDCTVENALCQRFGVEGFPTIKTFTDVSGPAGTPYSGGRGYDEMHKHVDSLRGPRCTPDAPEVCAPEERTALDALAGHSREDLEAEVAKLEAAIKEADEALGRLMGVLQMQYEEGKSKKERVTAEILPRLRVAKMLRRLAQAAPVQTEPKQEL